jgi:scyllo-inositol 2-dehydrogenase (NAD+)
VKRSKVKFAVIGCGHMGAFAEDRAADWEVAPIYLPLSHSAAIYAVPEAELVAVCDVRLEAAERAAERYAPARAYHDVEQMLTKERPEVVTIATRTRGRTTLIRRCIAAGVRGLFVEKPLSNSLEEADEVASEARAHKISFIYGTQRRHAHVYQKAREMVFSGEYGELKNITLNLGTSALFWGQPHAVDLALFFSGDVALEYVQAELDLDPTSVVGRTVDLDPLVRFAHLRFKNGLSAFIVPGDSYDVHLVLSRGQITVRNNGLQIEERRPSKNSNYSDALFSSTFYGGWGKFPSPTLVCMSSLAKAVLEGIYLGSGLDLAVTNQEVLFGMLGSHLSDGARIKLPVVREGWIMNARTGNYFA